MHWNSSPISFSHIGRLWELYDVWSCSCVIVGSFACTNLFVTSQLWWKKKEQKFQMWHLLQPDASHELISVLVCLRSLVFSSTSGETACSKYGNRSASVRLTSLCWVSECCIISCSREFCNCKIFNKIPCYLARVCNLDQSQNFYFLNPPKSF